MVVGCRYFPPGLQLPSQLQSIKLYCLVTEAHRCEQLAQGYAALARVGFELMTCCYIKSNAPPIGLCIEYISLKQESYRAKLRDM